MSSAKARKLETDLLQQLSERKHAALADELGMSAATFSRVVSGERGIKISELYDFLRVLDREVIPAGGADARLSLDEYQAFVTLSEAGVASHRRKYRALMIEKLQSEQDADL